MTPKEKAVELVDNFYNTEHCEIDHFPNKRYCDCSEMSRFQAKQCAIICCDEILNEDYIIYSVHSHLSRNEYWQEVKQEINKL